MPPVRIWTIDAFASAPFTGNPAAVCLLDENPGDQWMQAVAAEMNLAETSFVRHRTDGYELRWFTPKVEVDLCGHATLAAAHVLWSEGLSSKADPIAFHTRSGVLTCRRLEAGIELDFPATPAVAASAPAELLSLLGCPAEFVGRSSFDYLVVTDTAKRVKALAPDLRTLAAVNCRGVIVTAQSDDAEFDFVSRFFAPAAGVDEDPVTGSAHCCLGPYWGQRLGKLSLVGYQASARGGVVRVMLAADRVLLAGRAVTILRGELV